MQRSVIIKLTLPDTRATDIAECARVPVRASIVLAIKEMSSERLELSIPSTCLTTPHSVPVLRPEHQGAYRVVVQAREG